MTSVSSQIAYGFPNIKLDQLITSGPFDELYRVRDLDQDVWLLGRFYFHPIRPDRIPELDQEIAKCQAIAHPSVPELRKKIVVDNQLALFWEYRDGLTIHERLRREFGPRKIVNLISETVDAVLAANKNGVRVEYLSFNDVLVDIDDAPIVMPGTFSHHLEGPGDNTSKVANYDQRIINRIGAVLLSISFGREYIELIEAVQLETNVHELMDRFQELLDIDPGLMAIIAKCMMPTKTQTYRKMEELKNDLEIYLKGRAVTVDGIDFHQLIQTWHLRKEERQSLLD